MLADMHEQTMTKPTYRHLYLLLSFDVAMNNCFLRAQEVYIYLHISWKDINITFDGSISSKGKSINNQ